MIRNAMEMVRGWAGRLLKGERGQDLLEYAVLSGSIAIGVLAAAIAFGLAGAGWFNALAAWFAGIGP